MIFTQSEGTAARRRFPLYLVDATDGITPETGEAAGQPQISKAGGAWANTTATLSALGNGGYYVELTATELDTLGPIQVRYKSANTAEFNAPGVVVAYNQHDAVRLGITALPNAAAEAAGGLYTRGTGAGQINQDGNGRIDANATHFAGTAYATARAALVQAVWDALTTALTTVGSIGKKLADNLDVVLSTRASQASVDDLPTNAELATALGTADDAVLAAIAALNNLSQANVRTALGMSSANLDAQLATLATAAALSSAASDLTTLLSRLTATRAGLLDELDPATAGKMAAEVDVLIARLTAIRAGYLDNLSGGAAALEATLTAIKGGSWSTETLVAIAARLPAALTAGGYMKADALAINGATAAAVRLALSAGVIIPGTVDSTAFTPTTTVFDADDITTAAADHYIGRVIVFTSGTLVGQATTITDYALTSGRGRFTVDTLTSAPANDVTFVIV